MPVNGPMCVIHCRTRHHHVRRLLPPPAMASSTTVHQGIDQRLALVPRAAIMNSIILNNNSCPQMQVAPASEGMGKPTPPANTTVVSSSSHTKPACFSDELKMLPRGGAESPLAMDSTDNTRDIRVGKGVVVGSSSSACSAERATTGVIGEERGCSGIDSSHHASGDGCRDGHSENDDFDVCAAGGDYVATGNSNDNSSEWAAFDAAFRGKTVAVTTGRKHGVESGGAVPPTHISAEDGEKIGSLITVGATSSSNCTGKSPLFVGIGVQVKNSTTGKSLSSSLPSPPPPPPPYSTPPGVVVPSWGRRPMRRWVDQCATSSSSDGGGSSSSRSSNTNRVSRESSGFSEEEFDSFGRYSTTNTTTIDQVDAECSASAQTMLLLHSSRKNKGRERSLMSSSSPSTSGCRQHQQQQEVPLRVTPTRRLSLTTPFYDAEAAPGAGSGERNNSRLSIGSYHRTFAWCLQLHGCLCEAPLAVVEGIVRAPFYFLWALWVAVVARVGASGPGQSENRARLLAQARALAREGALLVVASLTLLVPCSTCYTVYAEVSLDHAWDVRPVPTVLGWAVDPLRFFVFANGQAGELAANGGLESSRTTPTRVGGNAIDNSGISVREDKPNLDFEMKNTTISTISSGWATLGARGRVGGAGRQGAGGDVTGYHSPVVAQSMDTDRLGVGILHPPHEVELQWRRAWVGARRAAAGVFRRWEGNLRSAVSGR